MTSLDETIQPLFDRLMWRLETRYTAPAILCNATILELVTNVAFVAAGLFTHIVIGTALVLVAMFSFMGMVRRIRLYNVDAAREWTPDLARRYVERALAHRETGASVRLIAIAMAVSAGVALAVQSFRDFSAGGPLLAMLYIFALTAVAARYLDSAVPTPPADVSARSTMKEA